MAKKIPWNITYCANFKKHKDCIGLYVKELGDVREVRCIARTHGGKSVLLARIKKQ